MNRIVSQMAGRGMRVLAVASHRQRGGVPEDLSQLPFTLEGLVGFLIPCAPTFLPLWLLHDALE